MSKHLTPVDVVEALIGGPEVLAAICGKHEKSPYGWRRASKLRMAGDIPSSIYQRKLLDYARKSKIALKPEWLIEGASEDDVKAAMEDRAA